MPLSFCLGISGLVVLVAVWVTATLVLRARRRRNGGLVPTGRRRRFGCAAAVRQGRAATPLRWRWPCEARRTRQGRQPEPEPGQDTKTPGPEGRASSSDVVSGARRGGLDLALRDRSDPVLVGTQQEGPRGRAWVDRDAPACWADHQRLVVVEADQLPAGRSRQPLVHSTVIAAAGRRRCDPLVAVQPISRSFFCRPMQIRLARKYAANGQHGVDSDAERHPLDREAEVRGDEVGARGRPEPGVERDAGGADRGARRGVAWAAPAMLVLARCPPVIHASTKGGCGPGRGDSDHHERDEEIERDGVSAAATNSQAEGMRRRHRPRSRCTSPAGVPAETGDGS